MPTGLYKRKPRGCYKLRTIFVPIGPSIAYVPLTRGQFALIDSHNATWIGKYNWYALWNKCTKSFYAARSVNYSDGSQNLYLMHREILGLIKLDPRIGDHQNRNSLDARICNLRPCDSTESACNQGNRSDNTSGIKGVCWNRFRRKWHATIQWRKKKIHIGLYDDLDQACEARRRKALELHGEFASEN